MNRLSTAVVLALFAILAISTTIVAGARPKGSSRIINGNIITIDQAPYIMQLRTIRDITVCGGTLVAPRYVITAAHCLDKLKPEEFIVVGGASTVNEKGVRRKVEKAFIHPGYRMLNKDRDVAVFRLDEDMVGDNIQAVPLCSRGLVAGDLVQVSGWGRTKEDGYSSDELRTVRLPIIDKEECLKKYQKVSIRITDSTVCAYDEDGKDSCRGDSGGPAINRGQLCGIVSWGMGCGRRKYPGLYTSIDVVRDFIEESMKA